VHLVGQLMEYPPERRLLVARLRVLA